MKKTSIVILGGGFAGLSAATYLDKTLARRADAEVTLINRHVKFVEAEVQAIDLSARRVRCLGGLARLELEFEFDHLLLTLGSETNFFNLPGVSEWAVTMKSMFDAAMLRNRVLALLEEANLQSDPAVRRQALTFVTAGGGFAGAETTGAINDFVRETIRYYPDLNEEFVRIVVIHPGDFLLPELGQELGDYAESKLRERKVDVIKGVRVASYDGDLVTLTDGNTIPASTLIWTAGVKPSPVIAPLPCEKQRGRLLVSEYLAVTGVPGLWAAGDCAAVPVFNTENFHPPTAQHGLREGRVAAKNIVAMVLDRPLKPFIFTTLGQLATIGRRKGVAMVFGIKFSGFAAWVFWRTVYLMKLPRLPKKLRVMVGWTLDLFFARDIEQMITLRDVEALGDMAGRIRARATQQTSTAAASTLEAAVHDQLK